MKRKVLILVAALAVVIAAAVLALQINRQPIQAYYILNNPCESCREYEGFLERFQAIVTGEDTTVGKPSPEPYLRGAEKLGVRPEACIVVENAPIGIESAKRAGAYCIALCTTVSREALRQADEIVDSFEALREVPLITQLLASSHGAAHQQVR